MAGMRAPLAALGAMYILRVDLGHARGISEVGRAGKEVKWAKEVVWAHARFSPFPFYFPFSEFTFLFVFIIQI